VPLRLLLGVFPAHLMWWLLASSRAHLLAVLVVSTPGI
jgi:hypothetical protein